MPAALIVALCFTGALLAATAYFAMGFAPLLTLAHGKPMDALGAQMERGETTALRAFRRAAPCQRGKFSGRATNQIAGMSDEAAAFLRGFF